MKFKYPQPRTLHGAHRMLRDLTKSVHGYIEALDATEQLCEERYQRYLEAEAKLNATRKEIESMRKDIGALQDRLAMYRDEVDDYKDKLAEVRDDYQKLEAENFDLQATVVALAKLVRQ